MPIICRKFRKFVTGALLGVALPITSLATPLLASSLASSLANFPLTVSASDCGGALPAPSAAHCAGAQPAPSAAHCGGALPAPSAEIAPNDLPELPPNDSPGLTPASEIAQGPGLPPGGPLPLFECLANNAPPLCNVFFVIDANPNIAQEEAFRRCLASTGFQVPCRRLGCHLLP